MRVYLPHGLIFSFSFLRMYRRGPCRFEHTTILHQLLDAALKSITHHFCRHIIPFRVGRTPHTKSDVEGMVIGFFAHFILQHFFRKIPFRDLSVY